MFLHPCYQVAFQGKRAGGSVLQGHRLGRQEGRQDAVLHRHQVWGHIETWLKCFCAHQRVFSIGRFLTTLLYWKGAFDMLDSFSEWWVFPPCPSFFPPTRFYFRNQVCASVLRHPRRLPPLHHRGFQERSHHTSGEDQDFVCERVVILLYHLDSFLILVVFLAWSRFGHKGRLHQVLKRTQ